MIRPFTMVAQLVWRPISTSMPAFAEMQVRAEMPRLWDRYRLLFTAVNVLGGFFAVLFAFSNQPFITVWTSGKMQWAPINDWLLALWLVLLTQLGSHNCLIIALKRTAFLKFVYAAEVVVFLAASFAVTRQGGFTAMIACSIACSIMFTFSYLSVRIAGIANVPIRTVLWEWQKPLFRFLAIMIPVAFLLHLLLHTSGALARLVGGGFAIGGIGAVVLVRWCLPDELIVYISGFLPRSIRPILKRPKS
jgi:O-antigen/teichoic acid export membrane protein